MAPVAAGGALPSPCMYQKGNIAACPFGDCNLSFLLQSVRMRTLSDLSILAVIEVT